MRTLDHLAVGLSSRWVADLTDAVTALAWSPDGSGIAAGSLGGDATLFDADDGGPGDLPGHPGGVLCAAWSTDGRQVALGGQDASVTLSTRAGDTARVGARGWVSDLAWRPGGETLAVAAGSDVIVMGADCSTVAEYPFLAGTVNALAWIGGTGRLGVATLGAIEWFDPGAAGQPSVRTTKVVGAALALAASRDGARLASGHLNGSVALWDTFTGEGAMLAGYGGGVERLSWRSDGAQLAVAAHGELDVWRLDGSGSLVEGALPLAETEGTLKGLCFHPTRPILASGGAEGEVCLWKPGAAAPLISAIDVGDEITALRWSPVGDALAVGTRAGQVERLDLV